jgi:hypothetical protein
VKYRLVTAWRKTMTRGARVLRKTPNPFSPGAASPASRSHLCGGAASVGKSTFFFGASPE